MALSSGERSAISRALARGGAAAVRRVRYGLYRVTSSSRPGTVHTVSVDAAGRGTPVYRCDCEAGLAGRPCWHAGAVYIAKVEHASGARVTGPATGGGVLPANVTRLARRAA
jgi:SWIM zinc finger